MLAMMRKSFNILGKVCLSLLLLLWICGNNPVHAFTNGLSAPLSYSSSLSFSFSSGTREQRQQLHQKAYQKGHRRGTELYNIFDTMGDMLKGGKLEAETNLPYAPPFSESLSISKEDAVRTFAIQERPISFTGEDFDIIELGESTQSPFVRVRGAMLHLPGKDKMRMKSCATDENLVTMDRVLIAATPSYDLYRHVGTDGQSNFQKIGWMEKKLIALTDTFDVYMEGKGGFGVTGLFKPTPAYRIEGDFLDTNFSFRNADGKIVARASLDGFVQFMDVEFMGGKYTDNMSHYQVQVAPGMDALLVLACVCCIDEEMEEERRKRKEERQDD